MSASQHPRPMADLRDLFPRAWDHVQRRQGAGIALPPGVLLDQGGGL